MAGQCGCRGFLVTNVILDVGSYREDLGEPGERNLGVSKEIQVESNMAGWKQEMTVENLLVFSSGKEFFIYVSIFKYYRNFVK